MQIHAKNVLIYYRNINYVASYTVNLFAIFISFYYLIQNLYTHFHR